jgi:hypothetical protein
MTKIWKKNMNNIWRKKHRSCTGGLDVFNEIVVYLYRICNKHVRVMDPSLNMVFRMFLIRHNIYIKWTDKLLNYVGLLLTFCWPSVDLLLTLCWPSDDLCLTFWWGLTDWTDWLGWLTGLTDCTDWLDWLTGLTDWTDWLDWLTGLTDWTDWLDWLTGLTDWTDW